MEKMKDIIAHIKSKQSEYNEGSAAHNVLRELEVTLPSLFADSPSDHPQAAEEILDKYLYEYPWTFTSKEQAIKAMQEYASLQRNEALREAIEALTAKGIRRTDYNGKIIFSELEKLLK